MCECVCVGVGCVALVACAGEVAFPLCVCVLVGCVCVPCWLVGVCVFFQIFSYCISYIFDIF